MRAIEPAEAEWASRNVFAPRKHVTFGFCVESRKLNALSIRKKYSFTRMDKCIHSLGNAEVLLALDANKSHEQIEEGYSDHSKTAFAS